MRRWRKNLIAAAAASVVAYAGCLLFFAALHSINEQISRCMDQSASQYIADNDQRRRECGSE
jgi:hypothetical protein